MRTKNYQEELIESLRRPKEAAAYLNAALEEQDAEVFLLALRNVADAFGGVGKLAELSRLNRENLYRMLSRSGNPELLSLINVLNILGLKLSITFPQKAARKSRN